MGATLSKLIRQGYEISIHIMSMSESIPGNAGIKAELKAALGDGFHVGYSTHGMETMYFHRDFQTIRDIIYRIKNEFKPDVVFCCSPMAIHPDHQIVGRSCDSIFMEQSIYCFEDVRGNQRQLINKWQRLSQDDVDKKLSALKEYKSQQHRHYLDDEGLIAMMRSRGLQVGTKYAEGFEVLREVS